MLGYDVSDVEPGSSVEYWTGLLPADYREDDVVRLVEAVEARQANVSNPDSPLHHQVYYSRAARELILSILHKAELCTKLKIEGCRFVGTVDFIAQEALNRFRLEIVDDDATHAGASLDRVRQEIFHPSPET